MRSLAKRFLPLTLFAAFVLVFSAPAAAQMPPDDSAGFYIASPMRVGTFMLEPATYLVRAVRAESNAHLLLIMDPEKTTVYAAVLATPHQIAETEIRSRSRLLFGYDEAGKPNQLRTFLVANRAYGYDIKTNSPAPTPVASRIGTIYAVAASK